MTPKASVPTVAIVIVVGTPAVNGERRRSEQSENDAPTGHWKDPGKPLNTNNRLFCFSLLMIEFGIGSIIRDKKGHANMPTTTGQSGTQTQAEPHTNTDKTGVNDNNKPCLTVVWILP